MIKCAYFGLQASSDSGGWVCGWSGAHFIQGTFGSSKVYDAGVWCMWCMNMLVYECVGV